MPKIRIKEWDSKLEDEDGWLFFECGRYYYYQDKSKCGKTFEIDKIEYDDDGDLNLILTRLESIFYSNYIPKEMFEIIEENEVPKDAINPSHYRDGNIEVIDYIEDKNLGFHLGNVVKYVSRAGKKDPNKTIEDLKKALWYLDRAIKNLEK